MAINFRNVGIRSAMLMVLMLLPTVPAAAIEHPGVIPSGAECASCHGKLLSGKSVHSVMAAGCSVCHITASRGDMTTVNLSMPKEKICSACHDEASALRQHAKPAQAHCVDCHDAHSSASKALLRIAEATDTAALKKN